MKTLQGVNYSLDILWAKAPRMALSVFFLFSSLSFFLSRRKNTNKHGVTATLTVAVRDKFIVGLMVRQVNVYVTVNWWAHATISTEWRMTDY